MNNKILLALKPPHDLWGCVCLVYAQMAIVDVDMERVRLKSKFLSMLQGILVDSRSGYVNIGRHNVIVNSNTGEPVKTQYELMTMTDEKNDGRFCNIVRILDMCGIIRKIKLDHNNSRFIVSPLIYSDREGMDIFAAGIFRQEVKACLVDENQIEIIDNVIKKYDIVSFLA